MCMAPVATIIGTITLWTIFATIMIGTTKAYSNKVLSDYESEIKRVVPNYRKSGP